ncbi:MAG TPA: capsid cement protein [Nocardioidaceae bacterium]|nr:capsid cement protein [Nocardioidaceae bacterium]
MTDYSPLYLPGKAVTVTASAAITGGKAIKVSGDGTVATNAAASTYIIGVAGTDAAASGDKIVAFLRGTVHRLLAAGTVTAGDLVEGAAAGAVATHTVGTNDARVFGIALTTASDGVAVEIMEL